MRFPDGSRTAVWFVDWGRGNRERESVGNRMITDRLDCTWCGSAASIEHGICQVCLMEYPVDTKVIRLPLGRELRIRERLDMAEQEVVAEKH